MTRSTEQETTVECAHCGDRHTLSERTLEGYKKYCPECGAHKATTVHEWQA